MSNEIFRVEAHALGFFFDEMVNTFDPDALIVGGGALETTARVSALVRRRGSRGHADPKGRAGRYADSCDAERRHRRCARRGD